MRIRWLGLLALVAGCSGGICDEWCDKSLSCDNELYYATGVDCSYGDDAQQACVSRCERGLAAVAESSREDVESCLGCYVDALPNTCSDAPPVQEANVRCQRICNDNEQAVTTWAEQFDNASFDQAHLTCS